MSSRSRAKARRMGAYAGMPENADLWDLSKREILEVALRFGERLGDGAEPGVLVREEVEALRFAKII